MPEKKSIRLIDYTYFVDRYSSIIYRLWSFLPPDMQKENIKNMEILLCKSGLYKLLGEDAHKEFVNKFMKKVSYSEHEKAIKEEFLFPLKAREHSILFLSTLAEFCEPLISAPVSPAA